ncbi:aspartate aminotransferase family protein [Filobacillus milosensis]|uniref:Aspartate aminotransferase family protein n=1 Tax=Filobacillus milosensis TaxID=94137 RepID=A0A4Y8IF54_9BACI|nr:aspartate aminotransferase family protein [Filobacillus milosensis]TFB18538.1 aspartate aminotransferase family protein [Filobacillus milosensis]
MYTEIMQSEHMSDKTRVSYEAYQQAKEVIPGGVTANIKYFDPHPIVMKEAHGSRLIDVDGNKYIDYLLCYGALVLGHGHTAVKEAVNEQINQTGTFIFGSPHNLEYEMARKLVDLFPGIDMVRYTNSGLEATLLSIRLAKAYTGKRKVAKFEGHYHGGYDEMLISVNPDLDEAGEASTPNAVPESSGLGKEDLDNTIILPFNDLEGTRRILTERQDELSAVILEPIQSGFIPADESFMKGLREITEELGILLIFDEVKTGFRLTVGGAQSLYNIEPDITSLGKVLGGGFPVGAVGGKKEVMNIMAPDRGKDILTAGVKDDVKDDIMFHSGTYNGHPVVLAAGLATIQELEKPNVMQNLLEKTNLLRQQLELLYKNYSITMQTVGMGSIFNIIFTDYEIKNYRDLNHANMELRKQLDYELLNQGIYTKPMNRYSMSIAHTDEDIQQTVQAHERAIKLVLGRS